MQACDDVMIMIGQRGDQCMKLYLLNESID